MATRKKNPAQAPMPFPEVGQPPAYPAPIANPGNTKPSVGTLPMPALTDPVGSFTHQPAAFPSPAPADYTKPGSPFEAPMPLLRPGETSPYQNPSHAQNQQSQKFLSYAMPVQSGLNAGSAVTATPNAADATLQAAGAGLSGAAGGAMTGAMIGAAGGPIGAAGGAAIGGLVGLVTGGIQAYTGLRAARDEARRAERVARDIQARQDARDAQARADAEQARADGQENMRYNRRMAALQSNWSAVQEAGRRMNEIMSEDESLKQLFITSGR